MKKILLSVLLFLFLNISFAQQNNIPIAKQRPADYEYLSAPDSTGYRTLLKMPSASKSQQLKLPYPIIFIHGFNSNSDTWNITTDWMDSQYGLTYGGRFDFCLNYDENYYVSNTNFHPALNADLALFTPTLIAGDYYYVNFDVGISGSFHPASTSQDFVTSNQSAIVKQGVALNLAIKKVLEETGRNKVILLGHSMGGLASREYLQNLSNWQDDGQTHVAKLVTTGTPHGGSNSTAFGFGGLSGIDEQSEAIRDLRRIYYYSNAPGVYLFGGYETDSVMHDMLLYNFYNVDVNCNGITGENITGLNQKNIYTNLDYSCIIGECPNCMLDADLGDGVVNDFCANLNNYYSGIANIFTYTDNSTLTEIHTDLPAQYYQNMQGLDEPNEYILSYNIDFDTSYIGFTTIQPVGGNSYDYDYYKFSVPVNSNVTVTIQNIELADLMVHIVDLTGNTVDAVIHSNGSSSINFTKPLSASDYYLGIYGTPTSTSYLTPYNFIIHRSAISQVIELSEKTDNITIYPNPFTTQTTVSFLKEQKNTSIKIIDALGKEIKTINFKGKQLTIEKGELQEGLYLLQITDEKKITVNKKIMIK